MTITCVVLMMQLLLLSWNLKVAMKKISYRVEKMPWHVYAFVPSLSKMVSVLISKKGNVF